MSAFPQHLVEMHQIGARTRERVVAPRQVPALQDHGVELTGFSAARFGFSFVRLAPTMSQLLACTGGEGEVWAQGRWQRLRAGQAYFTPTQVPHAYRALRGESWELCWAKHTRDSRHAPRFAAREPLILA